MPGRVEKQCRTYNSLTQHWTTVAMKPGTKFSFYPAAGIFMKASSSSPIAAFFIRLATSCPT